MSKKTIKALLEDLHHCNRELERFTDKSEKLETVRKAIKPSFGARLQRIQDLAKNLHSSIVSSWSCSCRSYHKANLQLDQREDIYASGHRRSKSSPKVCFTVSFTTSEEHVHAWSWQEAEIQIEEDDDFYSAPVALPIRPKFVRPPSNGLLS